jgi:DNA-binding XRE family transcriptional regulator
VTPDELVTARARLGSTSDQLAAELGVTPHVYEAWERGSLRMPARYDRILAFRLALADREAALEASGLPDCSWMQKWRDGALEGGSFSKHIATGRQHAAQCPTCQARERFVREHLPPLPEPPLPAWLVVVRRGAKWLSVRPEWARPAIVGAAAALGFSLLRVLFSLPVLVHDRNALLMAFAGVWVATAAGAVAGLLYSGVKRLVSSGSH